MSDLAMAVEVARAWFERTTAAHLELPTGPFGRPGGDLYRLVGIEAAGGTLTLNLEDHIVIGLVDPVVRASEHELTLTSTEPIGLRRKPFGGERWREERLPAGAVRLWVHAPLPHEDPAPRPLLD